METTTTVTVQPASPATTLRYFIKCDDCKVEIGYTDSLRESAEGGCCAECRNARAKWLREFKQAGN